VLRVEVASRIFSIACKSAVAFSGVSTKIRRSEVEIRRSKKEHVAFMLVAVTDCITLSARSMYTIGV